jgi:inward rectifier potassium channel
VSSPPNPSIARVRGGNFNSRILGAPLRPFSDLYHRLLRMSWGAVLGTAFLAYLALNLVFATLYHVGGDCIGNSSGSFADDFFFSVQTLGTIGYGYYYPKSAFANGVVTLESFVGLVSTAMMTGLFFSKFARPSARVQFSEVMCVHSRNGQPVLEFRIANERVQQILESRMHVNVIADDETIEGQKMRRLRHLKLERSESPMFGLSWTVTHVIDAHSPLHGLTPDNAHQRMLTIFCVFSGIEDTFAQQVHARTSYLPGDLRFGHRFADMMDTVDGALTADLRKLHQTVPVS